VRMTSLKRMMLGWRRERWLMISRCTFSSICSGWGGQWWWMMLVLLASEAGRKTRARHGSEW
jgi:hypothetical protein